MQAIYTGWNTHAEKQMKLVDIVISELSCVMLRRKDPMLSCFRFSGWGSLLSSMIDLCVFAKYNLFGTLQRQSVWLLNAAHDNK